MTQKSANPFELFDFTRFSEAFRGQGFDFQTVADRQHNALQIFLDVNRTAMEGYQSVFLRQNEILQDTLQSLTASMQDLMSQTGPAEAATKHVEIAREVLERAYENIRELTEMTGEANADAFRLFQERLTAEWQNATAGKAETAAPQSTNGGSASVSTIKAKPSTRKAAAAG